MGFLRVLFFVGLALLFLIPNLVIAQYTIPRSYDIGYISSDSLGRNIFGTAFVFKKNEVITCAHVIDGLRASLNNSKNPLIFYIPTERKNSYRLNIKSLDKNWDISILQANDEISKFPLIIDRDPIKSDIVGEIVLYCGFDIDKSNASQSPIIFCDTTTVISVSSSPINSQINFLNFKANIIGGYSGSPIINNRGEVVGMLQANVYGIKSMKYLNTRAIRLNYFIH